MAQISTTKLTSLIDHDSSPSTISVLKVNTSFMIDLVSFLLLWVDHEKVAFTPELQSVPASFRPLPPYLKYSAIIIGNILWLSKFLSIQSKSLFVLVSLKAANINQRKNPNLTFCIANFFPASQDNHQNQPIWQKWPEPENVEYFANFANPRHCRLLTLP